MSIRKLAAATILPILLTALTPMLFAQEKKVEVGALFDLTRINNTSQNYYGVGGLLSFLATPHVALEAEFAHDFEQSFSSGNSSTFNTSFNRSGLRITDGLFGFRLQNTGPVRLFGTFKTGFVNFAVTNPGTGVSSGFSGAIGNISNGDTRFAIYPGGGLEFGRGWLGLRLEAGDLMYFANGARNNLRVAVGPEFRF
jgi:hypothetical protein